MTGWVEDISTLEALYGPPGEAALIKVAPRLTAEYAEWIAASPFCALATVGPNGTDCSPRGDDGPVAQVLDEHHLAIPDRHGNNRIDSLRNIVEDGRISLMFLVPGSATVIRINGTARISAAPDMLERFAIHGKPPRSVIVARVDEVYFQCARAVMRGKLWSGGIADAAALPTPGQILQALADAGFDGAAYDRNWPLRAKDTLW
ncbi:pyridoxamine 5'-phosphate oxidase family protein [Oceanibium sediminis]|uniref:pyridoxamine 5'-phosphate oxidase family protein n=1 Tax=Oceanibium sediminis TaxID=2026339 RepID=UPI000DD2E5B5|nr:pyridoxamine 5'-phosphate oxidase family protein [Oceanibium sediminis]